MLRQAMIEREQEAVGGFRLRGKEVSRIEGFSDAAFAFALTLLVISLEVPDSFDDLLNVLRGLPAFAACFATLVWLWASHYRFFRRFGLQDRLTLALNSALLFVMMVYIYPLKFMFTIFLGMLTGIQPTGTGRIASHQVDDLFIVYGAGFLAVFVLLALMNMRAYALRDRLELNALERLLTRAEITRLFAVGSIGAVSIAIAVLLPPGLAGLAGLAYALIGLVEFMAGYRTRRKAEGLEAANMQSSTVNST